jgi:hypothetical protein
MAQHLHLSKEVLHVLLHFTAVKIRLRLTADKQRSFAGVLQLSSHTMTASTN